MTGGLTLPNSMTSIGSDAFYNCRNLTGGLTIPNSVTTIGSEAFYNCIGFTGNLIIANSISTISYATFSGCSGLTSLTLPNSVTSMSNYAFRGCSNMTSITIHAETPPTITTSTFYNSPKSIPVYVPCGSAEEYQSAAYWNEFTNIQEVCSQQTVTLSGGWNWFSTHLDITLDDLKAALVEASPNASITIQSQTQNITYNPNNNRWSGRLTSLDVTQMYMITVATLAKSH